MRAAAVELEVPTLQGQGLADPDAARRQETEQQPGPLRDQGQEGRQLLPGHRLDHLGLLLDHLPLWEPHVTGRVGPDDPLRHGRREASLERGRDPPISPRSRYFNFFPELYKVAKFHHYIDGSACDLQCVFRLPAEVLNLLCPFVERK